MSMLPGSDWVTAQLGGRGCQFCKPGWGCVDG